MKVMQGGIQKNIKDMKVMQNNIQKNAVEMLVVKDGLQKIGWNNINVPPKPISILNTGNNLIDIKFNQDVDDFMTGTGVGVSKDLSTGKKAFASGGKTGYPPINAFDGQTSLYYSWMTDEVLPAWIGVDLGIQYSIEELRIYTQSYIAKDFILQGSMDMENWTDVFSGACTTQNYVWQKFNFTPQIFRYWRVYITSKHFPNNTLYVIEVQLWGKEVAIGNSKDLSTSKTAFASGVLSGYPPQNAVDGQTSLYYSWRTDEVLPAFIGVDLVVQYSIEELRIFTQSYSVKDFILQGSTDNVNWFDVYTGVCLNGNYIWQKFNFIPQVYRYWRIYITSKNNIDNTLFVIEFQLWGKILTTTVGAPILVKQEVAFNIMDNNSKKYLIESLTKTNSRNLQLKTENFAIGDTLNINYNNLLGTIAGLNGEITDFTKTITTK